MYKLSNKEMALSKSLMNSHEKIKPVKNVMKRQIENLGIYSFHACMHICIRGDENKVYLHIPWDQWGLIERQ